MKCYDVVNIARTGSAKNMAYALPIINHMCGHDEVLPGDVHLDMFALASDSEMASYVKNM